MRKRDQGREEMKINSEEKKEKKEKKERKKGMGIGSDCRMIRIDEGQEREREDKTGEGR